MTNSVSSSISNITVNNLPMPSAVKGGVAPVEGEGSFKDFLLDSIHQVNSMQADADKAIESLATGGDVNPAEVLTAVQKADLAFRTVMQIRNKLVQAYQDVQNIRI
jgi:flagellar hook-basal body complex protein FliE